MSLLASSSMGASPLGARAVSANSPCRRAMRVELSGGLQDVHRAHRAGPVALGGKGPREDGARAPARAVSRGEDAGLDAIDQIASGGLDACFHRLSAQVVAAEDDVEGKAVERVTGGQTDVDDAGVRAGR